MLVLKLCQQLCPEKIPVSPTNKLGDGADGEVFEIKDQPDKVIKFCVLYETGNMKVKNTYKHITKVLDHLLTHPSPTHARVYTHGYLGEYTRPVVWKKEQKYILYYYVMEKLFKISEDESKVFHSIVSHEDRGIKKKFLPGKVKEILEGLRQGLDFDMVSVTFFYDNFTKTPVDHFDIHIRNIMKDGAGNFKMIDFDRAQLSLENNNGKSK